MADVRKLIEAVEERIQHLRAEYADVWIGSRAAMRIEARIAEAERFLAILRAMEGREP